MEKQIRLGVSSIDRTDGLSPFVIRTPLSVACNEDYNDVDGSHSSCTVTDA